QRFYSRARRFWQIRVLLQRRPLGKDLAAFFHANPIPDVITQDHIKTRKQDLREKVHQSTQMRHWRGNHQLVIYVSKNDELAGGAALVELNGIERPLRQLGFGAQVGRRSACSGCHAGSFCALDFCRPYVCSRSLMADSSSPNTEPPSKSLASSISLE